MYERVSVEKARKRDYHSLLKERFIEVGGFIGDGPNPFCDYLFDKVSNEPIALYLFYHRWGDDCFKLSNKLETARKKNLHILVRGEQHFFGLVIDEVLFAKQNGELSVYGGGLEGALSRSEEEGQLSLAEGEK